MSHDNSLSTRDPAGRTATRISAAGMLLISVAALLCGCASSSNGGGVLDKALEAVGLTKPAAPELPGDGIRIPPQSRKITLRLHAAETVNTDSNGKSLSLITRIYKLRTPTGVLQASYGTFKDAASERQDLGNDIVEVREVVLTPGKKYEVIETMPNEATHIAIVALLRAPDPQRWKFVFDAKEAARTGITLGMHACAMSVAEGVPLGVPMEVRRLAGMQCPAT